MVGTLDAVFSLSWLSGTCTLKSQYQGHSISHVPSPERRNGYSPQRPVSSLNIYSPKFVPAGRLGSTIYLTDYTPYILSSSRSSFLHTSAAIDTGSAAIRKEKHISIPIYLYDPLNITVYCVKSSTQPIPSPVYTDRGTLYRRSIYKRKSGRHRHKHRQDREIK